MKTFRAAILVLLVLRVTASAAVPFAEAVVFGDSLSDTGNVYRATFGLWPSSPPNYQGRFCNGPVWVEHLAARIGLPAPMPSRTGGTNYAHGGATTGGGWSALIVANVGTQIDQYLSAGNQPGGEQLVVVWAGANDLLNDSQTDPAVPVENLSEHITTLAAAGGVEFLVPNLPPLGQTPAHRGQPSEPVMDELAGEFNDLLAAELDQLEVSLQVTIFRLDVFELIDQVLADPAAFGFANVTDPALQGDTVVPNPDEYLFWDDLHPTTAAHARLAEQAAIVVSQLIPGDANLDGMVTDTDASILAAHWQQQSAATWTDGDFNGDWSVTDADAAILAAHWQQCVEHTAVVAEPSLFAMLLTAAASALAVRPRRHLREQRVGKD